ncbi:hypothetical protein VP01_2059g1 [Puccinia sorghi]|uniref:Uncharacterized protein n=1 Tax=Puccinia sorghi TaxID=27349 RepID=A0A0L6VAQ5_9BASI|nr:hypothetical protein VP01_2059g1 [Puccinia sorghi]
MALLGELLIFSHKPCRRWQSQSERLYGIRVLKGKVSGNLFTVENPTRIGPPDKEAHYSPSGDQIKEIHESYGHS